MNDEVMVYTVAETARLLKLGRTTCYELIARGELPTVRVGRSVRVPAEALRAWVRDRQSDATDAVQTDQAS